MLFEGWPGQVAQLNRELKVHYGFREGIIFQDGLIFTGQRIIIPRSVRNEIIEKLHESHIGIQGCTRRARECVYWPGMTKDIENSISQCKTCESFGNKQQKEPLMSHEIPTRPWEKVCCDFAILITVDYF